MPPIGYAPPKTIGIVGSRRRDSYTDLAILLREFNRIYRKGDRIVSGGCPRGGDNFAESIASSNGITITIHHADWVDLGLKAGLERNTLIAEDCDILIALVAPDRKGGAEDTVRKAKKLGKPVILC